jgi:hypothetical protein
MLKRAQSSPHQREKKRREAEDRRLEAMRRYRPKQPAGGLADVASSGPEYDYSKFLWPAKIEGHGFELDDETERLIRALLPEAHRDPQGLSAAVRRIVAGEYIDPAEWESIKQHNAGRELPPLLRRYDYALAQKEVRRRRGQRSLTEMDEVWLDVAVRAYEFWKWWLQRRKERYRKSDPKYVPFWRCRNAE